MGTPTIIILVTLLVILATLIPSYRISKKKGVTESDGLLEDALYLSTLSSELSLRVQWAAASWWGR